MRIKAIIISLVLVPLTCIGQNNDWEKPSWWNKGKGEQKPQAIIGGVDSTFNAGDIILKNLVILRQDYSLYNKKSDVYYGYNDQDYFGTSFSLAIKCENLTLLFDQAIHPWNYDSKYEDFKDRKLEPQITKTQVLLLSDSVSYNYSELDSVLVEQKAIKNNLLYAGRKLTSSQEGLILNTADTCKTGKLIWLVKKSGDFENGDIKLDFVCVQQNVEMLGNATITPPANIKDILGCLFITDTGKKDAPYCLSGIATLQKQQWVLSFPFKDFKLEPEKEKQKESKEKGRLTEIKKSNKK